LADEYLALGARIGAAPVAVPTLRPPAEGARAAAARIAAAGFADRPLALLAPGALYGPAKRWDAERFAVVGRALAGSGHGVAVCGSAAEAPLAGAVARAIGPGAVSLAGPTDLPELAGLCALAPRAPTRCSPPAPPGPCHEGAGARALARARPAPAACRAGTRAARPPAAVGRPSAPDASARHPSRRPGDPRRRCCRRARRSRGGGGG